MIDDVLREIADALVTSGQLSGPAAPPLSGLTVADALFHGLGELALAVLAVADAVRALELAVERIGGADQ